MQNLLNIQEKENKLIKRKNGNPFHKKVLQINRTDKTTINSALFRDIFSNFSKKYGAENLIIRGLSNTGIFTFKELGETNLNFIDFHEYFQNRVKDTNQFEYFYNVEVTEYNYT